MSHTDVSEFIFKYIDKKWDRFTASTDRKLLPFQNSLYSFVLLKSLFSLPPRPSVPLAVSSQLSRWSSVALITNVPNKLWLTCCCLFSHCSSVRPTHHYKIFLSEDSSGDELQDSISAFPHSCLFSAPFEWSHLYAWSTDSIDKLVFNQLTAFFSKNK